MNRVNLRFKLHPMDVSSSDDAIDDAESLNLRKKNLKRRKMRSGLTKSQLQDIEAISDGESDEAVDINDSDGSDTRMPSAMVNHHLHPKADVSPFIGSNENQLIGMMSGGENDGSYSSPLSQKSGKNMADFDDDDSPCGEELAQLAATSHCLNAFAQSHHRNVVEQLHANSPIKASLNRLTSNAKKSLIISSSIQTSLSVKSQRASGNEVAKPSNFLLWDLLMDDKIVSIIWVCFNNA